MNTFYTLEEMKKNDDGWIFYDAALKCWKAIYTSLVGDTILDLGCASGIMMALTKLFNYNISITGLEGSSSALLQWEKRNLDVRVGDIYNLSFGGNEFDTVYSSHVLEHCVDVEQIIKESIRVAKHRVIHIVPDGNVNDKNFGSPHIHIFNRINFLELFPKGSRIYSIQDLHINSLMVIHDIK